MSIREEVLKKRYFKKNSNDEIVEDWQGLCRRVCQAVAHNDKEASSFYEIIHECLFLPNTPALTNAGKEKFSMSACFVLPVEDSMEGIFDAVKHAALVHKMGGGTGFNFSTLRPNGDTVGSTQGIASGPCSFMRVFDTATDVTKQGGTRRGANMGILRVDHPDIMEFLALKKQEGRFSNFNLSVGITDEFIEAFMEDRDFDLTFDNKVRKTVRAKKIWDTIIDSAWRNGEPGMLFLDTMNKDNPLSHIGRIEATNPCGELPLLPYEACVLGSINLSNMVSGHDFDWKKLKETIWTAVRFLDNIIDIQHYPLVEVEKMHKNNRKIGLGVMGWADALIKLKIMYASDQALSLAEKVMKFISDESVKASERLAQDHDVFPAWRGSLWENRGIRVRNATITTIAPTGSISIIAGCSSGIEPNFGFITTQKRVDSEYTVLHPLYEQWKNREDGSSSLPSYFIKAMDVPLTWHIRMQAAFQKHIHNAVSKTINLPYSAPKEDVERAFMLAYELGCKGVTVYRDGSRTRQVISSEEKGEAHKLPEDLPAVMDSKRVCIETVEGKVYLNISMTPENDPLEVFITTPVETKHAEIYEAFARILSTALRGGISVKSLLSQLEKANKRYGSVSSIPNAIIRAFKMLEIKGGQKEACPDCGGLLVLEEGCMKCHLCGYTRC